MISHQVVKVAVLSCEPSKQRMLLSFKLLNDSEPKNESVTNSQKKGRAVNIGQLVDVKVLEKNKDGLEVAILPDNIPGFLPTPHLSDHVANGPLLHHWLQAGDTLHRVLCLSGGERHIVSLTGIWGQGTWMGNSRPGLRGEKNQLLELKKCFHKTKSVARHVPGKQEQAQKCNQALGRVEAVAQRDFFLLAV